MDRDTLALLGDCTAGLELTASTIEKILPNVKDQVLRRKLQEGIRSQEALRNHTISLLDHWGGSGKHPDPLTRNLTRLKTGTRLALCRDDPTAAELAADGCDLGIRSLCRSRNRYAGASQEALFLTDQAIACQEKLSLSLRAFL